MAIGAALAILVVIGAVALASGGGAPTKVTQRRAGAASTSSSSSTSTSTTIVPRSGNAVIALAQQYDGAYEGSFHNTPSNTMGTVTLELRIDPNAGTLDITSRIDGDVFGTGNAEVRMIRAHVKLGDPNAEVATQTKAFGAVTARIDQMLRLVVTAADVPGPEVKGFELTGAVRSDRSGFDATYTVSFEDGRSGAGTIGVTCSESGQRPGEVPTLCQPPA